LDVGSFAVFVVTGKLTADPRGLTQTASLEKVKGQKIKVKGER
jgi:hypothetical protein